MNVEKLKRLQVQVRIGGKGTPRRKKKVMHQTAAADDKKLQSSLKKLSVSTIPGIEEVNIIKDDLTVVHFNNPKAQASLSANTFAVTGHGETKKIVEMLPEILPQLGQETVVQLRMFANSMTKNQKGGADGFEPNLLGNTDEDDVPLLVSDFDEIAKKEDLSKEKIQQPTKGSALNAEIITTHESAPIQSTEKYSSPEIKPTDNAIAVASIEPLQSSKNIVKTEKDVKKDNIMKIEIRNQIDNTKKTTLPDRSGTVKEGNIKKEHKPKSKATDSQPSPSQREQVDSITEPYPEFNEIKGTDVKETVKKNKTKTTEKFNTGTNVKEVNVHKEGNKPKNKSIDGALNPSQFTTADPLMESLHNPNNNNVKITIDIKKDNTKKSEKNNTKKTTEAENAEGNFKKESIKLKNKVIETDTSSISQQQIESNKLLTTKELKQDVIKTSDKSLDMNVVPSSKVPANIENVAVTEIKCDQLMISNAQTNKNQIDQTKTKLNQKNFIESNLIDNSLLFMDSNAGELEISNNDIQQEKTNVTIPSLEHDKEDSHVADTLTASSCKPEEIVEQLKVTSPPTVFNEELKKENSQEIQDVLDSINSLENTIKSVAELKDAVEPAMALLTFENLEKKIDCGEKQCETNTNIVIDVQEVDGDVSILKLETKIKDVEILQNVVIPGDAELCLEEKKVDDPKVFDHTKETQIEEMLDTSLIEIEKKIKDVQITQDPVVSLQFVQEKLLAREEKEVLENLKNMKTQPDDVKIFKDLVKTVEEPKILNTISSPEELEKQVFDDKPQFNIDANLTAKSNIQHSSKTQNKDSTKKDTGKPQLTSTMNSESKKPDQSVRPKQVSPPKSHVQLSSPTGTTPKTQQASKSAIGSTLAKQEKSSVAPKPKQTLSASIKSQSTATASKSLTTQPKKSSVSPPSSDSAAKNSKAIKASSAPEMSHVAAIAAAKARADNNNPKGTKKSKPQSVTTTVEQKVAEDPPKPSQ